MGFSGSVSGKQKEMQLSKGGKKNTTAVAWHRPGVQRPTFLDWQRPATYKSSQASLFTKAEEAYLGGTAADGCGMSKYTDKKQKWPNRNSHRNPNLWLQCCTAEVKTMAGCSYWDLKQFSRQEQNSRKQPGPQDRINSTKTTTLQTGHTLSDFSYHDLLTAQAAVLKQPFQSTFTLCTKYKLLITVWKLFQQRHWALHNSRTLGPPQSLQVVNLHDKQKEKGTEPKSLRHLWLGNFCPEISTFPDPDFRESSAFKEDVGAPGFWQWLV